MLTRRKLLKSTAAAGMSAAASGLAAPAMAQGARFRIGYATPQSGPLAAFAFRLQGAYFAIGTWVIAEITRLSLAQWRSVGDGTGTSLPRDALREMMLVDWIENLFGVRASAARNILAYWLALILAVATVAGTHWLLRTKRGLALAAVRDNTEAAKSAGDEIGLKLCVQLIGPRRAVEDLTGDWARARKITDSGCILVRPDHHVAGRVEAMTDDPAADLRRVMTKIQAR